MKLRAIMVEDSQFFTALNEKKLDSRNPVKLDEALAQVAGKGKKHARQSIMKTGRGELSFSININ